jgi:HEAT repeat protein
MVRRYYLICLFLVQALCLETQASDEAVLSLLQGYEWKLQEQAFYQLGEAAVSSLIEIAEDENQVNFIRARAATALTLFPGDEAWEYYESEINRVANDRVANDRVRRRQLVQNFCTSFALSRPQQVEAIVMPLLKESDAHLRVKSARCLSKINGVQSREALAAYRELITEPWEARAAGFNMEIKR